MAVATGRDNGVFRLYNIDFTIRLKGNKLQI